MSCFWAFVFAIFWGVNAGVVNRVVPFEVWKCNRNPDVFPAAWRPWQNQCNELVALQGIAWTLCKPPFPHEARVQLLTCAVLGGVFVFFWIGLMAEVIEIRPKRNVKPFYRAKFLDNV